MVDLFFYTPHTYSLSHSKHVFFLTFDIIQKLLQQQYETRVILYQSFLLTHDNMTLISFSTMLILCVRIFQEREKQGQTEGEYLSLYTYRRTSPRLFLKKKNKRVLYLPSCSLMIVTMWFFPLSTKLMLLTENIFKKWREKNQLISVIFSADV